MSDLFDPLRSLEHEPVSPLPPSEVRRRGDRRRRRTTAAQLLGGAVAVALVAVGAGVAVDGSTQGTSDPAPATQVPSPSPTLDDPQRVTRVPDGFPLDRGMVEAEEVHGPDRDTLFLQDASICGDVDGSPPDGATDAVGVSRFGIEFSQSRELRAYPDAATAQQATADLLERFQGCPTYPVDTGDTASGVAVVEVAKLGLGDEAWAVKKGYRLDDLPAIGHEVWLVVRVGTALLVSVAIGEGPGLTDPAWFERAVDEEVAGIRGTVRAMCVFADGGC
jgi:hypothetical protein